VQPSYISVMNVFTQQTRYTVPLFQRPYVWKKEDQWKPLWDDIEAAADRVLSSQGQPVASHFLGTVVLEQTPNPTFSLPRREVIDGQQRLTTLQLVLKAAEHALDALRATVLGDEASTKSVDVACRQIAPLTSNPAYAEEEERYKVWPTNEDRAAFRDVMDANAATGPKNTETRMAEAYLYFRTEFTTWLAKGSHGERATSLASALKDHLRLIVLDLDSADEPQAIFETLNAHGTPLLPADLIKNWLLWEGSRQSLNVDQLYIDYWQSFDRDSDYWRALTGVGHAARARVDTFLQNWLTRHVREAIPPKHLYDRFLRFTASTETHRNEGKVDVAALMNDIAQDAMRFRAIEAPQENSRFHAFLRRLKILDIVVFHPLILELMGRAGSDDVDRDVAATALESYLIRRLVCGNQTRGYGSLNLTLLDQLSKLPTDAPAAPTIVKALSESGNNADQWPDDTTFLSDWCRKKFYGNLRRNRVLMILQAIEEQYQIVNTKSEPVHNFNFGKLEIEHVLPQAWETHWTLPETISREDRNWALHGIGNLTLISGSLNKELSHGPWTSNSSSVSKSGGLAQHSKLELNARLLRDHPDFWDENAMQVRAKSLFEVAQLIWPQSSDFHKN
jgi:uncharacterized protein with ParB-like and HNH nuclease domain